MPDIRLTRIDNRLIHGQVATQWCGVVGANLLLVANDEVAGDEFRQGLMNMAAPSYAQTRFFTLEKTINIIHKASANQHIAIICESPQDVLKLVEGGVPIKKVNIGNMHMADGKRQVATSVAVDDDDVATFRKLQELGVELEIKRVPDTPAENIEKLLKGPAIPKPGPTLPIHVKQAESVVSKSKSSKDTINNIDPNINIKQKK